MAVLHSELTAASDFAGDNRAALTALQSELAPLVDDVTTLAQHLCSAAGIQVSGTQQGDSNSRSAGIESGPSSLASDSAAGPTSLGSTSESNKENISPGDVSQISITAVPTPTRLLHSLQEQVRVLRRAAEGLIKQNSSPKEISDSGADGKDSSESDVAELQEQIVKLKGCFIYYSFFFLKIRDSSLVFL